MISLNRGNKVLILFLHEYDIRIGMNDEEKPSVYIFFFHHQILIIWQFSAQKVSTFAL